MIALATDLEALVVQLKCQQNHTTDRPTNMRMYGRTELKQYGQTIVAGALR